MFVESGGIGDPYFNYAHNVNMGVSKALEYHPKWIVVSNDDIQMDCIEKLIAILQSETQDVLISKNESMNGAGQLFKVGFAILLIYSCYRSLKLKSRIPLSMAFKSIWNKNATLVTRVNGLSYKILRIFSQPVSQPFRPFLDFGVFKSSIFLEHKFNENFLNGVEDWELSLRLIENGYVFKLIDFSTKPIKGGGNSLGNRHSVYRLSKNYCNMILLLSLLETVTGHCSENSLAK